jgi:outer membrane protein assembly factor BamB
MKTIVQIYAISVYTSMAYEYEHCVLGEVMDESLKTTLRLAWSLDTQASEDSSVVVFGGIAYVGSDSGYLFAVDARTGNKVWPALNGTGENSTPVVDHHAVYMIGANALRARDRFTGSLLWETSIKRDHTISRRRPSSIMLCTLAPMTV